jgi:branched-chain amino acid transport system substrate-binding protein
MRELLLPLLLASASSCVFLGESYNDCQNARECQASFGFGATCSADGYCVQPRFDPRCQKSFPRDLVNNASAYRDLQVIGSLMDQSLATHRAREQAFELAVKQINASQPEAASEFGVLFCTIEEDEDFDALSRNEAAVFLADYLVSDLGLPALFGPSASDDVLSVAEQTIPAGALLVSPSATSPALSDIDDRPNEGSAGLVWRTAAPDSLQGRAIALDMRTPGQGRAMAAERVGVVYDEGVYGSALAEVFQAEFEGLGGTATLLPFSGSVEQGERTAEASIGSFDEVLFISSQSSAVISFLNSAAGLEGFDNKSIFLTDAAANADVLASADSARFSSVRGTRPASKDPSDLVLASLIASYAGEYGENIGQFSFAPHSFDAAWLMLAGLTWATGLDSPVTGAAIAEGLRQLSSGQQVEARPSSWSDIRESMLAGESVDLEGASGSLDYDLVTEETSGPIETWLIQDGQIEPIEIWE